MELFVKFISDVKRSLTLFIKVLIGFFNFHVFPENAAFQAEGKRTTFLSVAATSLVE